MADTSELEAEVFSLDAAATAGGNRTFGGATVIAWEPSSTEVAVKVTVMFQGTIIAVKKLDPTNLSMNYNGTSGADFSKGTLKASFSGTGNSGQLETTGPITWAVSDGNGSWTGFIGDWVVS